jgi:predicted negative regulator of RcsB-dependent stress response
MAFDTEEQEQIDAVKKWISANGLFMLIAVLIGAVLLFGYQQWRRVNERHAIEASMSFEQLLNDLNVSNEVAALHSAQVLITHYPHSTYAQLAELLLAKKEVQSGDYNRAQGYLLEVIDQNSVETLKEIARLRLARLYIERKQPQDALHVLQKLDSKTYQAEAKVVEGDAYLMENDINAARANYQQALAGLPEEAILHGLVSMKLNNLPT